MLGPDGRSVKAQEAPALEDAVDDRVVTVRPRTPWWRDSGLRSSRDEAGTRRQAFWERLAREVDAGASKVSVAAKHGVSAWSVGMWCRRLAKERRPQLLPVRVVEQRVRRLELFAGSTRIAFEEGTSPDYVAAIARALGA